MKHKPGCSSSPERQITTNGSGQLVEVLSCNCGAVGVQPFVPPPNQKKSTGKEVVVESGSLSRD